MNAITTSSEISGVEVYPDRARITSTAKVELAEGSNRVTVENLPMVIIPESIRVGGEGTVAVRIGSVDMRRAFFERAPVEQVRQVEDAIEALEDEKQELLDEESILKAQGEFLDGLRKSTDQYARGLSRGKTQIEDYARLSDYLQEQDRSLRRAERALLVQQRDLDLKLTKLRNELNQLTAGRAKQGYQAVVDLVAGSRGEFNLDLRYLIQKASWRPLYDIRLKEEEGGHKLDITTLAEISQNSGFDWAGVQLSVSTSRPAISQRAPELKPWYIDEARPMPAPQPRAASMQLSAGAAADMDMIAVTAAAPDMAQEARHTAAAIVAQKDSRGPSTTYRISGHSDIPGDGSPHKTTVSLASFTPDIDYLAVPKQVDAVYRRVKAANDSGGALLAGKVNLFAGSDFIGSVALEFTSPGDEIELLFGTEERISIERELTQRAVEKTRLRDRRELTYGYEIKVNNLLAEEASIEVQDHIPVARHEDIKVELERSIPEPTEKSELNLMKWQLQVPANTVKSIQYEYTISHPRQMRVMGLID